MIKSNIGNISIVFLSTRSTAERWINILKSYINRDLNYRVYEVVKPEPIDRELDRLRSIDLDRYGFIGFTSKSAIDIVFRYRSFRSKMLKLYYYGVLFFTTGSGSWSLLKSYGIKSIFPAVENTSAMTEIMCRSSRTGVGIALISSIHIDHYSEYCRNSSIDHYKIYRLNADMDKVDKLASFINTYQGIAILIIPSRVVVDTLLHTLSRRSGDRSRIILYLLSQRIYRGIPPRYIDHVEVIASRSPTIDGFLQELASFVKKIIDS